MIRHFIISACLAVTAATLGAASSPAFADLRLCNTTTSRVGIAIGYKTAEAWRSEGWWNVKPGACETLLNGNLSSRYVYIYAQDYDRGGEWSGTSYLCTQDRQFTIDGVENCLARGYDRMKFFEVDTGEQKSWTVQLTDPAKSAPK
jgi:uncharacterized membrane protein